MSSALSQPSLTGSALVVDDDPAIGMVLAALLGQMGLKTERAAGGHEALRRLTARPFDLVITDFRMPEMDGLELVRQVTARWPEVAVVVLTAHGTIPLAVEAMKAGATDFLLKTFEQDEIMYVVQKALLTGRHASRQSSRQMSRGKELVAVSAAMHDVLATTRKAAAGVGTVLIRGESGTGKELVARAIHDQSARSTGPFIALHCGAFPESLLESELFGYEKGAFTGAVTRKPGRIELAQGGTVFLDEIGDVTSAIQIKLLRLLQEREFERLGGTRTVRVDVRFVAATHRNLEQMIQRGEFRSDLFYRLDVVPLWIPPLRSHAEDVAPLAEHFCAMHGPANGRPGLKIDRAALQLLQAQPWPGNVRQLENFVERLVLLTEGPVILAEDVLKQLERQTREQDFGGLEAVSSSSSSDLQGELRRTEREAILKALQEARNNRSLAARMLGVSRSTLYLKLEEHGLL